MTGSPVRPGRTTNVAPAALLPRLQETNRRLARENKELRRRLLRKELRLAVVRAELSEVRRDLGAALKGLQP